MATNSASMTDLLALARSQRGVTTAAEAARLGLTRSQVRHGVRSGILTVPHPGVLVVAGSPPCWEQRVMVATAALGGPASHRCAARLHRMDGFDEAPIEITIPHSGTRRAHHYVVHRTRRPDDLVTVDVEGIPTTSIARTLVDLGAVCDDDQVEQALDDVLRRGFNLRWIDQTLAESMRPGFTGCAALQRVLARPDRQGPIPDSTFERLIERLVADAGVPAPHRQILVTDDGEPIARIDAGWPEIQLGLEADSELWHWGPRRGRAARVRHNRLTALGWEILYASWQDVEDPTDLIAQVRTAVGRHHR